VPLLIESFDGISAARRRAPSILTIRALRRDCQHGAPDEGGSVEGHGEIATSGTPWESGGDSTWVGGPGLAGSLWRYRIVIVIVAVLAACAGYAASLLLPPRYEAQANLYLRDPGSPAVLPLDGAGQSQAGDHAIFMATQARLAASDEVYGRAAESLGPDWTPADVRSSVEVEPSADLTVLTITGTSSDPVEAADLANAVGAAYQQVARERIAADAEDAITQLRRVVDVRNAEFDALRAQAAQTSGSSARTTLERKAQHVADLISELQIRQDDIAARAAMYGSGIVSFERATPPTSSSQPAPVLLALLGGVVGLIVAGGWAWWAAGRNRRVEAEGDAGAILGVPLLGETPRLSSKLRGARGSQSQLDGLDPVAAEAYHFVLASLEYALSRTGGKVVAVVSAGQGDGKTVTVLNLALAAKQEGRRVRLIDADERTRQLSQLCRDTELFSVIGLGDNSDESAEVTATATAAQNGAGAQKGRHPAVLFRSTAFGELVNPSDEADLVLIDTPALLGVSEAVTIADKADAVLLVVNRGTSLNDLRRARERLAFTDTPLIGYLLNRGAARRGYAAYGGTGRSVQSAQRSTGAATPPRAPSD
jgi:Mrp family chromosome partitioning ATPase/capsular polysaccharide biosynthesis protein